MTVFGLMLCQEKENELNALTYEKNARAFYWKQLLSRLYIPSIIVLWLIPLASLIYSKFSPGSWVEQPTGTVIVVLISLSPFALWSAASWYIRRLTDGYELHEYHFPHNNRVCHALVKNLPDGKIRVEFTDWRKIYRAPTHREQVQCTDESRCDGRVMIAGREYSFQLVVHWEQRYCDMEVDQFLLSGTLWGVVIAKRREYWQKFLTRWSRAQWNDSDFSREQVVAGVDNIAKMLKAQEREGRWLCEGVALTSLVATFHSETAKDDWEQVVEIK